MNEPFLALYVKDNTLFFTKKLPTENLPREILEFSIDEITSDEFDDASRKLGTTVVGILSLWHKDAFQGWGAGSNSSGSEDQAPNEFDIAVQLISKSVFTKTKVHVQSIDALLRDQAEKTRAAKEFLDDSWPTIRARLERFV